MDFVAPHERPQITTHCLRMARVPLIALKGEAITESNHHPEVKALVDSRRQGRHRPTGLDPRDARDHAQGMSRANELSAICATPRMFQPHQHDVGHCRRRARFCGAAEEKKANCNDGTRPKAAAIISWRAFHCLLWFTNFGQISGLANIFGTVGKDWARPARPFQQGRTAPRLTKGGACRLFPPKERGDNARADLASRFFCATRQNKVPLFSCEAAARFLV